MVMIVITGFELLVLEDYALAQNLFEFALELRGLTDQDKEDLKVSNFAIALKFFESGRRGY